MPSNARANAASRPPVATTGSAAHADAVDELRDRDLEMPVDGVDAGDLRDTFFDSRGGGRPHEAIDIMAPRHTPVRAVDNGVIQKLFTSNAGGLTIYQFDPSDHVHLSTTRTSIAMPPISAKASRSGAATSSATSAAPATPRRMLPTCTSESSA